MKRFFLAIFVFAGAFSAHATVDGHSKAFIVVKDINSEEFFVERVAIIGCYGLAQGPQLIQLTSEYKIQSSIGCGMPNVQLENINYLTCAKVIEAKESDNHMSFSEITLDISKCSAKEDSGFVNAVKKAAKLNFPQKTGKLKLTLVK